MLNKNLPAQKKQSVLFLFGIVVYLMHLTACNPKQASYFRGNLDTSRIKNVESKETVIQKNDILSITVFSDNPAASAIYNQPIMTTGGGDATSNVRSANSGYLVNEQGDIYFQGLGQLHIAGLTKTQLVDLLNEKLKTQLKNPYYAIRFLNYNITVQGEVNRGGEFSVPNERITILEAIALAGDMTMYAKRNDVLIIRELNGKREVVRVDLTSPDIFNSPYYYLYQNDLIIVEPTNKKPAAGRQETVQNIGITASIVSAIALIIAIFRN
jgi:polysaccharide biosynthesis/export protein